MATIRKRGKRGFERFIWALVQTGQTELAEALDPGLVQSWLVYWPGPILPVGDVTWFSWRLKSSATWMFVHQLVWAKSKWNIKARYYWPFVREIPKRSMDSPHKWPVMRKSFLSWRHMGWLVWGQMGVHCGGMLRVGGWGVGGVGVGGGWGLGGWGGGWGWGWGLGVGGWGWGGGGGGVGGWWWGGGGGGGGWGGINFSLAAGLI